MRNTKNYLLLVIILCVLGFIYYKVSAYQNEYGFSGVNKDEPTLFYTLETDNIPRNKEKFYNGDKMDEYFRKELSKEGIKIIEFRKTDNLVEYTLNTTWEANEKFLDTITGDNPEITKKKPKQEYATAFYAAKEIGKEYMPNENDNPKAFDRNKDKFTIKVGVRVAPSIHIPVIEPILIWMLNIVRSAIAVVLIIIFAFIFLVCRLI